MIIYSTILTEKHFLAACNAAAKSKPMQAGRLRPVLPIQIENVSQPFPSSDNVPNGNWNRDNRQANVNWNKPENQNPNYGARSAVIIVEEEYGLT